MNEIPTFQFAIREDLLQMEPDREISSFLPARATDRATGWDVKAATHNGFKLVIRPGSYIKIPLGFRVLPPAGWWLELRPRSSSFTKKQLHCLYGVIDEDYQAECIFACQYLPDIKSLGNDLIIDFGEKIGQIIPVRRQEMLVEQITNPVCDRKYEERNAQRGTGGFGSTGK